MPTSTRYECILAVLNDPMNRAIVEREILRRSENLIPPPVPRIGGGFVYLTAAEYRREHRESVESYEDPETHAEVFGASGEWYVAIDEAEIGPFTSISEATREAENLLASQGITVLHDHPWTKDDERAYPL